jgi:hypothetical protein
LKIHPLPTIDTQVLFRDYQPIDGREIIDFLIRTAISVGLRKDDCKVLKIASSDLDIRVLCGDFHILVTQTAPLEDKSHLGPALQSVALRSKFPAAEKVVQAAKASTLISVQKGLIPHAAMPSTLLDKVGPELTAFSTTEEARIALTLARIATYFVVKKSRPVAVLWGPSHFLMKPEVYLELARGETPELLYLHPHLYGEVDAVSGQQLVGVIGAGAHTLIGHTLEFKPSTVPPNYLANKMYEFVAFCRLRGQLIPEGDVFGADENEKIQVIYHLPKSEGNPPGIELKVVHNPDFGIVREPVPTVYKRYDKDCNPAGESISDVETALNPNDPVDAAILERLSALKATEKPATEAPAADQADFDAFVAEEQAPAVKSPPRKEVDLKAVEEEPEPTSPMREPDADADPGRVQPEEPSSKRSSMEELRRFAKEAQVLPSEPTRPAKKPGLLGKFFSRKTD